ncbi:MAG: YdeI/OmpD-associated family protein [Paracoccaceae bacterium]|nr:YdeI/OmpD-associated family protein [Paracoccaceae bacterium]
MRKPLSDKPQVVFETVDVLRDWLAAKDENADGIWAVTYKKAVPDKYISTGQIVDACLSYGWVDSLVRGLDAERTMLYICPRKTGSNWSRVNKDKVAKLTAEGLMTPAGQAVIDRSKADGSWTALDDVENLVIPADLQSAFDAYPGSLAQWEGFPRSVKRGALEIVLNAKRPETRAAKIAQIARDSAAGKRPFQWTGPKAKG